MFDVVYIRNSVLIRNLVIIRDLVLRRAPIGLKLCATRLWTRLDVSGSKYMAFQLHSVSSLLDATKKTEDVLRWGCGCAQKDCRQHRI